MNEGATRSLRERRRRAAKRATDHEPLDRIHGVEAHSEPGGAQIFSSATLQHAHDGATSIDPKAKVRGLERHGHGIPEREPCVSVNEHACFA